MALRPQTYIRGLHRAGSYSVGGTGIYFRPYSTSAALLDANSSGLIVVGALFINGSTVGLTKNSTGIKLGARYLSTNTTGNATT
jgi:hypothetical protein